MGAGRDRSGAYARPGVARHVSRDGQGSDVAQARAHAHPPGGRRDPDGRTRRGRRLHRRNRAPALAAGGNSDARCAGRLRADRTRVQEASDLPGRARERRGAGPAQALPRIRDDAARAGGEGNVADGSLLSRSRAACAEARHAAGDSGGKATVLHGEAAAPLSARPAVVASRQRRRRRRQGDARCRGGDRGRNDAAQPPRVLVDRRCAARRPRRAWPRIGFRREAAARLASTCRSAASSRARPRSPTGCGAKSSITSRSARPSRRRCRPCKRDSGCRDSFPPPKC